jgi:hypothetical protein
MAGILGWPAISLPADTPATQPKDPVMTTAPPVDRSGIVYTPPKRGTPGGRVGGGTRSLEQRPVIAVLAPDHVGLTIREQPSLYWYLSKPVSGMVEFTLIDSTSLTPILETQLRTPLEAGIQPIHLSDYGIQLATGVSYSWFVALVLDTNRQSKDAVAGGMIERIAFVEALSVNLAFNESRDAGRRYAEAGLWYDAIAVLSERIDAAADDPVYRTQRAALLEQVGLPEVAAYDRRGASPK